MKKSHKDYRELIQDVQQLIWNRQDKLNPHNCAEAIVNLVLRKHTICDHNPHDTIVWTIAKVKGLKPYPFKD